MMRFCQVYVLWVVVSCRAVAVCLVGWGPIIASCHGL